MPSLLTINTLFQCSINTFIGIYQEGSAQKAAEALKAMLSADAVVLRDGVETRIPASVIVPGDIVVLSLGDRIPADIRLLEVNNLASAEAALTGESVPIEKQTGPIVPKDGLTAKQVPLGDRNNMLFSATLVAQGSGVGVIISTGDYTEIGTINALVGKVEKKKTAVLQQIDMVSTYLAIFIGIVALFTFLFNFFSNDDVEWLEALNTALVCAVAMIPEGLEAIVTVVYAWAVSKMARENAIVRALPAVETLGRVTTICSDKTGTLTTNVMSCVAFVTSNARYKNNVHATDRENYNFVREDEYLAERANIQALIKRNVKKAAKAEDLAVDSKDEDLKEFKVNINDTRPVGQGGSPDTSYFRQALATGILCSKCTLGKDGTREGEIGNPTELSILRAVYWTGVDVNAMKDDAPIIAQVPFSSEYKFMATVHHSSPENDGPGMEGKLVVHVKGAPDRMVTLCDTQAKAGILSQTEPIDKEYWLDTIATLSLRMVFASWPCCGDQSLLEPSRKVKILKQSSLNPRSSPWLVFVLLSTLLVPNALTLLPRPTVLVFGSL